MSADEQQDPFASEGEHNGEEDPFATSGGEAQEDDMAADAFDDQSAGEAQDADAGYEAFGDNQDSDNAFAEPVPSGGEDVFAAANDTIIDESQDDPFPDADEEDDGALREFNRKWEAECAEKDAMYAVRREELRQVAAQKLEEHKQQLAIKLQAKHSANMEAEEAFTNQIKAALDVDNSWERVLSLVDLNANDPANTKDVSRLRQMLIQLKNDPLKK